jgi:hypothetical protein
VNVVEKILPINYYNELSGLMTDTSIVQILLKGNFKDIYEDLEESGGSIYLNNAVNKWLLSIFMQGISEIYTNFIWDMFLLEGNIIVFKTIYAMIILLESHIIKCKTFDQLNNVFNDVPMTFDKRGKLAYYLISKKFNFNMDMIKKYRKTLSSSIINEIINLGNLRHDSNEEEEENDEIASDKEVICDLDWPLCIKDKKNLENEYDFIVLKQLEEPNVIDNYIDNFEKIKKMELKGNEDKGNEKFFKEKRFKELLIERKKHFCDSKRMTIRDNLPKIPINFEKILFTERRKTRKISSDFYKTDFNIDENSIERNKTINKIIIDIANDNKDKISFIKENVEKALLKDY